MKKAYVFIILCLVVITSAVVTFFLINPERRLPFTTKGYMLITDVTFQPGTATIYVMNMGEVPPGGYFEKVGISSVTVDGVTKTILATGGNVRPRTGSGPYDLAVGASGTITISLSWTSGNNYTFAVTIRANHHDVWNYYPPHRATAP